MEVGGDYLRKLYRKRNGLPGEAAVQKQAGLCSNWRICTVRKMYIKERGWTPWVGINLEEGLDRMGK
jgi:hypothetical protein